MSYIKKLWDWVKRLFDTWSAIDNFIVKSSVRLFSF
jgi:hypothetical protein